MASKLIVNEIEHTDGSGTAVTMAKATIADATITAGTIPAAGITGTLGSGITFPAGHVLQAQSTTMGDSMQINPGGANWVNVTGLAVTITPSSASNKILFAVHIQGGATTSVWSFFSTLRSIAGGASTTVGIGNHISGQTTRTRASASAKFNSNYDVQSSAFMHLDSPATTSAVTYQVRVIGNGIFNCNRSITFADNVSTGNFASTITVWEIKA